MSVFTAYKPSLQKPFDMYFPKDPAFAPAPEPGDTAEAKAARDEYDRRWGIAWLTGDYTGVLAEGKTLADATRFVMRPLTGLAARTLVDLAASKGLGPLALLQLFFRAALVDIVDPSADAKSIKGGLLIKLAPHEDESLAALGRICPQSVVDDIDSINAEIVSLLGAIVKARLMGVDPL